jgi:hypothetical protein
MKKMLLSTLWVLTVSVNSGSTNVNVSMPESSFDSLLSTFQVLFNNSNLWGSDFLSKLFQLI